MKAVNKAKYAGFNSTAAVVSPLFFYALIFRECLGGEACRAAYFSLC